MSRILLLCILIMSGISLAPAPRLAAHWEGKYTLIIEWSNASPTTCVYFKKPLYQPWLVGCGVEGSASLSSGMDVVSVPNADTGSSRIWTKEEIEMLKTLEISLPPHNQWLPIITKGDKNTNGP